jgi:hypothetical protein
MAGGYSFLVSSRHAVWYERRLCEERPVKNVRRLGNVRELAKAAATIDYRDQANTREGPRTTTSWVQNGLLRFWHHTNNRRIEVATRPI